MAGLQGFEPQLPDPESGVLPLDDSPSGKFARHYSIARGWLSRIDAVAGHRSRRAKRLGAGVGFDQFADRGSGEDASRIAGVDGVGAEHGLIGEDQ